MSAENDSARAFLIAQRDEETAALKKDDESIAEAQRRKETRELRVKYLNELIAKTAPQNGSAMPLDGLGKYANMTVRDGILDILKQTGAEYVPPSVLARRLLAEGAKSKSPNFPTIVLTECKRLQGLGKLERGPGGFRLPETTMAYAAQALRAAGIL
jgi:hypothetical protein